MESWTRGIGPRWSRSSKGMDGHEAASRPSRVRASIQRSRYRSASRSLMVASPNKSTDQARPCCQRSVNRGAASSTVAPAIKVRAICSTWLLIALPLSRAPKLVAERALSPHWPPKSGVSPSPKYSRASVTTCSSSVIEGRTSMNRKSCVLKTTVLHGQVEAGCDHQRRSKSVGVRPAERRASCSPIRYTRGSRGEESSAICTPTGSENEGTLSVYTVSIRLKHLHEIRYAVDSVLDPSPELTQ